MSRLLEVDLNDLDKLIGEHVFGSQEYELEI